METSQSCTAAPTTSFMSKTGLLAACELANRTSRKRSSSCALHKLALSYQSWFVGPSAGTT